MQPNLRAPRPAASSSRELKQSEEAWVVEAWRQRGLLADDVVVSKEQLAAIHAVNSQSWFARRNRNSPHVAPPVDTSEATSWLARRNRRALQSAATFNRRPADTEKFDSWLRDSHGQQPGALEAWVRTRLLSPAKQPPIAGVSRRGPVSARKTLRMPKSPSSSTEELPTASSSEEALTVRGATRPPHATAPSDSSGQVRTRVELTLYDLCNCCNGAFHLLGVGVYHSGIVVEELEYTYDNVAIGGPSDVDPSDSGVTIHAPYHTDEARARVLPLRGRLVLGYTPLRARECHRLLRRLATTWIADEYDMVERNCHHWCGEAATALSVAPPPFWVLRASAILKFFSGMPSEREQARERLKQETLKLKRHDTTSSDDDEDESPHEPLLPTTNRTKVRVAPEPRVQTTTRPGCRAPHASHFDTHAKHWIQ